MVIGYFLNDDITAVLSIPSFDVKSEAIFTLSDSVGEFIRKSKEARKERMIVDLQRNGGVGNLLAIDVFKQVSQSWSWGNPMLTSSVLSPLLTLFKGVDYAHTTLRMFWEVHFRPSSKFKG